MYIFLVEKYIFTSFAYKLFSVKIIPEYIYLGKNISKYCSQIIVVDVHANDFL